MDPTTACPECGAPGCRDKFGEMLALEFESPSVFGAVHHVTVICFNLQHPGTFTDDAVAWMRASLSSIVEDELSPTELRNRAGKNFEGKLKIRRAKPAEPAPTNRWSMSVLDVRTSDPETYVKDVMAWARSIVNDLKAS